MLLFVGVLVFSLGDRRCFSISLVLLQALVHYHFAAMAGNADASMALGFRHMHGIGVPRNCFTAAEYYLPVAKKGVALSLFSCYNSWLILRLLSLS